MDEYLRDFVQESEENITELNNALLELERDPDDDEAMGRIFRMAHTLKGNAGAMGFEEASNLAHAIEDLLEAVRSGEVDVTPELMDEVFAGVDELETMLDDLRTYGEIRTDASDTIERLREVKEAETGVPTITDPDGPALDEAVEAAGELTDESHDVYHVRLAIEENEERQNGRLVVKALADAFDLLGTVPDEDALASGDYDGTVDAVFGSAVGEAAISAALDPVDAVADDRITEVTDRYEDANVEQTVVEDEFDDLFEEDPGADIDAETAQDMSVDDLLSEFDEYDDLDAMVEEMDDVSGFDDLGDAGSFDDIDFGDELEEGPAGTGEPAAEADLGFDEADSDEGEPAADSEPEPAPAEDPDEEVDDAAATFAELKQEVDPVGFDELQDELAELEFDEYSDEEEVGFDELLGDDFEERDDDFFAQGESAVSSGQDEVTMDELVGDDVAGFEDADEPTAEESDDLDFGDGFADDGESALADADSGLDVDEAFDTGDEPADAVETDPADADTADPIEADPAAADAADAESADAAAEADEADIGFEDADEPTDTGFEDADEADDFGEVAEFDEPEESATAEFGDDLADEEPVELTEADDAVETEAAAAAEESTDEDDLDLEAADETPAPEEVDEIDLDEPDDADVSDESPPADTVEAEAPIEADEPAGPEAADDSDDFGAGSFDEPTGFDADSTEGDAFGDDLGDDFELDAADPSETAAAAADASITDGESDDAAAADADIESAEQAEAASLEDVDAADADGESADAAGDDEELTPLERARARSDPDLDDVEVGEFELDEPEEADTAAASVDTGDFGDDLGDGDFDAGPDTAADASSYGGGFDDPGLDYGDFDEPEAPSADEGDDAETADAGPTGPVVDASEYEVDIQTLGDEESESDTESEIQSIRVDVEQVDKLLNLVEGLVTSRVRLRRTVEEGADPGELDDELDELEDLTGELQDTVMDVRLVPVKMVANKLPRVVRDISREQDKQVAFEMQGESVELDRSILDQISDPLVHIVRNAVDHGIESPEERAELDKPDEGHITLSVERARDQVVIEVEDDGRGLDPDRLREEAVEEGILTAEEAEDLSDSEAFELVFHPGLSTASEVTDVSGRGVGMDVVKSTVNDLDGSVSIESEPGEGTTIRLLLPVTVAIADVLFVESGDEEFGVPVKVVRDIGPAVDVREEDGQEVIVDGDETLPLVRLNEALETPGTPRNGDGMYLRIRGEVRPIAVHCDEVRGQQEVVVKPFEGVLGGIPGLSGATVLGEGEVVNILDVKTL
ncbi:Hpt domain-containing protein [Haloarchaeobius amylolyticus]|uniref:Hpt domain-containing protein n=1 Tax=Haloarchaeobius amylolyticus TaxID=1198296 RepID=UPI0022716CAE|nr:Hpt domain-containing protein [Haloarchaeobius amylolyticus]